MDVPDYTAHDLYVQQKAELNKEHKELMQELEQKKHDLEDKMSPFQKGSRDARKYQIEREELEHEIEELQAERDEKLEKAIKKQLVRAKAYVESIFDTLERDSRTQAIRAIAEKEEQLTALAIDIIESEIRDELDLKTKKLEALKSKMTLAEQDKNERIQKIDDAQSALTALRDKADSVRAAIESIETDVIKEQ